MVHNLAREFTAQGHAVEIITNRYPRTLPRIEEIDGILTRRFHFLVPSWRYVRNRRVDLFLASLVYYFHTSFALNKVIREFQPDIINSHYLTEHAEFVGRCLSSQLKVPWVVSFHGGDVDGEPALDQQHMRRFQKVISQADSLTFCSHFLKQQAALLNSGISEKTHVIHNGVDIELFSGQSNIKPDFPFIFAIGRLERHKGFDILIDAFARVDEAFKDVRLLIAGGGILRADIKQQIEQQGLQDRVKLIGSIEPRTVADYMRESLFVVVPSRRESFGIVALEAMAAGKCVLASPVGGIPEFLPCSPNKIVPLDVSDWTKAMQNWLEESRIGTLPGIKNREFIKEFSWTKVSDQYMKVFKQAIGDLS